VDRQRNVLEVGGALSAPSTFAGRLNRRQQKRRKYCQNGDNDKQFDQRYATTHSLHLHRDLRSK
jgi:hypothetical protein